MQLHTNGLHVREKLSIMCDKTLVFFHHRIYVTFSAVLLLGICTSKIYGFKGFVASRVCRLTDWSFLSLLLQGSVICYFKGLTFVTSRVCRLLLQGLVVCYFKGLTFVTSRVCCLLLQGSVVCYFKG